MRIHVAVALGFVGFSILSLFLDDGLVGIASSIVSAWIAGNLAGDIFEEVIRA